MALLSFLLSLINSLFSYEGEVISSQLIRRLLGVLLSFINFRFFFFSITEVKVEADVAEFLDMSFSVYEIKPNCV
jgi:hypothetical protein